MAEAVAVAEDALLGAGFFLVAAGTADQGVEAEFLNRLQQRHRLMHIAAFSRMRQAHGAALHGIFHAAHNQLCSELLRTQIAEGRHFGEVVAGIDHQQRVGNAAHAKGFFRALEHHQRILAAGKQQGRAFKRSSHFAQDEDGFLFQRIQMLVGEALKVVRGGQGVHTVAWVWATRGTADSGNAETSVALTCRPHSLALSFSHHQRPERKSSPRLMARVQGSQPMLG